MWGVLDDINNSSDNDDTGQLKVQKSTRNKLPNSACNNKIIDSCVLIQAATAYKTKTLSTKGCVKLKATSFPSYLVHPHASAKVCELEMTSSVKQHVVWLNVSANIKHKAAVIILL